MTPNSILEVFTRHKKDLSDVSTDLFLDWCDQINQFAYRIIWAQDPEQYLTTESYTVASGDNQYALPDNYSNSQVIGAGLYVVENGVQTDQMLPRTHFGSSTLGYYLNGIYLYFTPIPTATATYNLRYIPTLDSITELTDTMVIPNEFMAYVKNALDVLYTIWDEDPSIEGITDERFVRAMDELAQNIRCDAPVVGLDYFEGAFMN